MSGGGAQGDDAAAEARLTQFFSPVKAVVQELTEIGDKIFGAEAAGQPQRTHMCDGPLQDLVQKVGGGLLRDNTGSVFSMAFAAKASQFSPRKYSGLRT